MERPLKVLISSYACNPNNGSEDALGWNIVKQLAALGVELWVVTLPENRAPIEAYLAEHPIPQVHWVYHDVPKYLMPWRDPSKPVRNRSGERLHYQFWQATAYAVFRQLHQTIRFDITHHLSFSQYWTASFLALLPVPFVWGPVGGAESAPRTFYKTFDRPSKLYELARDVMRVLGEWHPVVRVDALRAKHVWAATQATYRRVQALGAAQPAISIMTNVGLDETQLATLEALPVRTEGPFRVVSIGQLKHLKGFQLGIKAFATLVQQVPTAEYWLIGEGRERPALEALVQALGLNDKVRFLGHMPRSTVLSTLAECDVMVHPALHDSGGSVCLEAMASGRPMICLDLGGPGDLIVPEAGIKIPAITPEQAVEDLAQALLNLAQNPALRQQKASAGRAQVRAKHLWEKRAQVIHQAYLKAIGTAP